MNPTTDFPTPADCYSPALTRAMGLFAAAAYAEALAANQTEISLPGYETRVVITREANRIVLAFRGTVNLRNWLTDLDVVKQPWYGGIEVHRGFYCATNALIGGIIDRLLPPGEDKGKLPPLFFTGHSLGGALATLAAFTLAQMSFPIAGVFTFASPRVGNGAWRARYQALLGDLTWRVCAAGDAVPLVPGLLAGYRHVGIEVYLDGRAWIQPCRWHEILMDSVRTWWAVKTRDWDFLLEFHSLQNDYLAQLQ